MLKDGRRWEAFRMAAATFAVWDNDDLIESARQSRNSITYPSLSLIHCTQADQVPDQRSTEDTISHPIIKRRAPYLVYECGT